MPIVRTRIVPLIAETNGALVFPKKQSPLAMPMKFEQVVAAQVDPVVRLIQFLDNQGGWIDFTNLLNQVSALRGADTALSQYDAFGFKLFDTPGTVRPLNSSKKRRFNKRTLRF